MKARCSSAQRLTLLAALAVTSSCNNFQVEPIPVQVTLSGEFCTENSTSFGVPIRILLVIDTSKSMEINDPADNRASAAAELISNFSGDEKVSFGFVGFDTEATRSAEAFTRDPEVIATALSDLRKKEGFTNYIGALEEAKSLILSDIEQTRDEFEATQRTGASARLKRPWYFVVFLSDGVPRMPGGTLQEANDILWRVEDLVKQAKAYTTIVSGITLHTAFLGASDDAQRPDAVALLSRMAQIGGGSFSDFESGDQIDFTLFNFEVTRQFDIKQFVVYNTSAVLGSSTVDADTDHDGLIDELEISQYHSDPFSADTDQDGCRDGFEVSILASDPTAAGDCACLAAENVDTDGDGLSDCEERSVGYDPAKFDTDGDLFPDGLELRAGTNAADVADVVEDLDFDGVESGEEIRRGTRPNTDDTPLLQEKYGYRYALRRTAGRNGSRYCYQYQVANVSLAPTEAMPSQAGGTNVLNIEFIESPEDAPDEVFYLRRVVVPLSREDFRNVDGTQPVVAVEDEFVKVSTQESSN
ncbi:MAG: VWA domain-containing protein [Deltaproteobacteria bacterium]|nr:VWA domain-containing protein [Deltaproteobacteria bacterium]